MKLLIVEDENEIRSFIKTAIEACDKSIDVGEARNGMEAVRLIAADPPDAILLDMLMPDMDGWEFLQVMDALETSLPVAILTAVHRDNAALCGVMTTYANVVTVENKPVSIETLGKIIDMLKTAQEKKTV